jgi:type IV pilus assembly protein PilC
VGLSKEPQENKLILFHFEAFDVVRHVAVRGSWWAKSREQAEFWLQNQGYTDILLRPMPTTQFEVRVDDGALALFFRQLAVMIRAGVSLSESLRLASFSEDRNLNGVSLMLAEMLRSGYSLSDAMRSFPAVFDPVMTGLVAAAESSGRLPVVMVRLADSQDRRYKLKRTLIAAVTYPAILSVATLGLSALFFLYIFPINQELFASMNLELPALNRWLGQVIALVKSPWMAALILGLGGWTAVWLRSPGVKYRLGRRLLKLARIFAPVEKLLAKGRALRMLEILGLLLDGGGTLDLALKFMLEASADEQEHEALKSIRLRIIEGEDFAEALRATDLFPPLVVSLLEVGQETGQLEGMARRGSEICEEDLRHTIDTFSALIEPVLLAFAGFVAGIAIITSVMPMLSLLQGL